MKTLHASKIRYEDFEDKLAHLLSDEDLKKVFSWKVKNSKRQMSPADVIDNFYQLMKKVSLKAAYEIFPHFIRTLPNEDVKEDFDYEYVKTLKSLPFKNKCLLSRCKTYGSLFKELIREIETNI